MVAKEREEEELLITAKKGWVESPWRYGLSCTLARLSISLRRFLLPLCDSTFVNLSEVASLPHI